MTSPRSLFPALAAVLIAASPVCAQPEIPVDFSALETHLSEACASGEVSGVVAVIRNGSPLFQHICGEADPVNGIANEVDTRFKIFSTSKYLTAIAVMRLSELNVLELDAPISTYIAEAPASWSDVTLRSLLNHTSGLPDLTEAMLRRFDQDNPSAMRATLTGLSASELAPLEPVGARFRYNNFGFEILAHAAASAQGRPFDVILQELVFDPAGMTTASVEAPNMVAGHPVAVQEDGLAIGFNGEPGNLQQAQNWAFIQLGAGAVRASLSDMIALDRALTENRLISAESLTEMRNAPVTSQEGRAVVGVRGYGLGVVRSEHGGQAMIGHSGGTNGYIADFEQLPDHEAALIVLTNRGFTDLRTIQRLVGESFSQISE